MHYPYIVQALCELFVLKVSTTHDCHVAVYELQAVIGIGLYSYIIVYNWQFDLLPSKII